MSRFDRLSRDKLVVNCRTPDEADRFVRMAHDAGKQWENAYSGQTFWGGHGTSMCYRIRTNRSKTPNIILYNSAGFYRRKGFEVIPFNEFMNLGGTVTASSRVYDESPRGGYKEPSTYRAPQQVMEEVMMAKSEARPDKGCISYGDPIKKKPSITIIRRGEPFRI